jgi:hypothetical protein
MRTRGKRCQSALTRVLPTRLPERVAARLGRADQAGRAISRELRALETELPKLTPARLAASEKRVRRTIHSGLDLLRFVVARRPDWAFSLDSVASVLDKAGHLPTYPTREPREARAGCQGEKTYSNGLRLIRGGK